MTVCPRIQRAFLAWLEEARPRLERKVSIRRRTNRAIDFGFDIGGPILQGGLYRHEITIAVDDGGVCWDLLANFEAFPQRSGRGTICTQCPPANGRVFTSREELWRDHLFEPFLTWVNGELAAASAIALFGSVESGFTEAKLIRSDAAAVGATKVIRLARGVAYIRQKHHLI